MNYVYIVCAAKDNNGWDEDFILYSSKMIKSLDKYCNCTLIINTFAIYADVFNKLIVNFSKQIIHHKILEEEWINKRMFSKINGLLKIDFKYGDNVFVLDTDLLVQDDIFKVFERNFDVCYTTRYYKYYFPINAGVWGFKYNERSKKFLKFYVEQMLNPTWQPYIEFCKKFKHNSLDWWCDQDFLCTVYNNSGNLPVKCKILDIGPKYNFCPGTDINSFEVAKKQIINQVNNKEYKILHFKAKALKKILVNLDI